MPNEYQTYLVDILISDSQNVCATFVFTHEVTIFIFCI